jgi:phage-related minor tail protein
MPNQLEIGRQSFSALMSGMESALQNFVRTGKFSFKDFARSLIQDMIMIQARAQMMNMMKGVWSMFGGGTPSVDLGYGGGSSGAVGISAFADGGNPPVGKASLVGERGPELFVPRTAGTVIPNNQLASAMGGGQTVNYNGPYIANMSAIDTQSGAQFLAKNKQAVWATYQSANRSIPVTR